MNPSDRIGEAVKQTSIAREELRGPTSAFARPDRDAALARAEYILRGVRDELEENELDEET